MQIGRFGLVDEKCSENFHFSIKFGGYDATGSIFYVKVNLVNKWLAFIFIEINDT